MKFSGTIKKLASLFRGAKMQNHDGANPPQNRPSPAQFTSDSKFSWIFLQPMGRDKYAHVVLWEKVPAFLKSHTGRATNNKINFKIINLFVKILNVKTY